MTTYFASQTASRAFQNQRFLELKIEFVGALQKRRDQPFPFSARHAFCRSPRRFTIGDMNSIRMRFVDCLLFISLATTTSFADDPKKPAPELPASIVLTDYLVLPVAGQYGRLPLQRDAIEAQLVAGNWKPPSAGHSVKAPGGKMC